MAPTPTNPSNSTRPRTVDLPVGLAAALPAPVIATAPFVAPSKKRTANGADAECRTANLPVGLAVALPPPVITAAAPISSTTAAAATETNVAAAIGALVGAMKHFKETAVKSNNPATFKPVAVVVAWTRFLEDAAASSGK